MEGIRDWFTAQIRDLGFGGLEGVFDYVDAMSDAEVREYFASLLGSDVRIEQFASSFIQRRSAGSSREPTANIHASSSDQQTSWTNKSGPAKKSLRNNQKRTNSSARKQNSHSTKRQSFAEAATSRDSRTVETELSQNIRQAPVEQARRRVREYRKANRPVNCVQCGKIECPVREDGMCSFCGAAIFSITDRPRRKAPQLRELKEGSRNRSDERRKAGTIGLKEYSIVLGRYVSCPTSKGDILQQPPMYNLAERAAQINDGTHGSSRERKPSGQQVSTSLFTLKMIDDSQRRFTQELRAFVTKRPPQDSKTSVPGRLMVDGRNPSVVLPES